MSIRFCTLLAALLLSTVCAAYSDSQPPAQEKNGFESDMNQAEELLRQGHRIEAEAMLNNALSEAEASANNQNIVQSLDKLYALFINSGRYRQAEQARKKIADLSQKEYGPDSSEYAQALEKLASLYRMQKNNYPAELLYHQILRIREQNLYKDEKAVQPMISSLITYGNFYMEQGKWPSAQEHFKHALQLSEKYHDQEKIAEINKSLKICQTFTGAATRPSSDFSAEHQAGKGQPEINIVAVGRRTKTQTTPLDSGSVQNRLIERPASDQGTKLANAAQLLSLQGKYEDAEALFKRALEYWLNSPPAVPGSLATCFNNLGLLYHHQGKFNDAIPMYQKALSLEEKSLSPEDPLLALTLDNLAQSYRMLGKYAEAEPLYKRALALEEKTMKADDPDMAITTVNLSLLYIAQGKYAQAEPLLKQGLSVLETKLGPRNPDYLQCLTYYADLLHKTNRNPEAEKIEAQINQVHGTR